MDRRIQVVLSEEMSGVNDPRYMIVDSYSYEIIDSCQGVGYRSKEKAMAAYFYQENQKDLEWQKEIKREFLCRWFQENYLFIALLKDEERKCQKFNRTKKENVKNLIAEKLMN